MGAVLFLIVLFAGALYILWKFVTAPPPPPKRWPSTTRHYTYSDETDDEDRYESPLGLVDRPEDEWLEWAIMDDVLDGPDQGIL